MDVSVCAALFVHNLDRMGRVQDLMTHIFVRLNRRIAQRSLLITSAHLLCHQVGHESHFTYANTVVLLLDNSNKPKFFYILIKSAKTNEIVDLEFVFCKIK